MAASPPRRKAAAPAGPAPGSADGAPLLSILVKQKVLSPDQADRVHRATRVSGSSAAQTVTQLGLANETQIAQALATHAGLEFVTVNPLDLDLDVVTRALPGPFARKTGLVALSKSGNQITIAVHDPFAPFPREDIERVTGLEVVRVVATRADIERINKTFYDLQTSLKTAEKQLAGGRLSSMDIGNQEFLSASAEELDPAAAPVVKALDHIMAYAFEQRASDIHFEPKRDLTLVRLRIDGILHDVHLIPKIVYKAVVSRIKLLSGCDLAEMRRPQDGRI
jgi:general secretion pathway protein E